MPRRLAPLSVAVGRSLYRPTTTILEDQDWRVWPGMKATTATPPILSSSARLRMAVRASSAVLSKDTGWGGDWGRAVWMGRRGRVRSRRAMNFMGASFRLLVSYQDGAGPGSRPVKGEQ